jgi:hypothetical protein
MIKMQFSRADKLAGPISRGVYGLHADDVDQERETNQRRPKAKGGALQKVMRKTRFMLFGVKGLHACNLDQGSASQPLKACRR